MELNALGQQMAYAPCACEAKTCSGYLTIEPDRTDGKRVFMVYAESGDQGAYVWLTPDGLRDLINQAEELLTHYVGE